MLGYLSGFAQNPSVTIGQGQDAVRAMYFEGGIAASELFGPRMVRSEGITVVGSPFVEEDFNDGEIVIKSDNPLEKSQALKCKIRFNAYENAFEFLNKADTLLVSRPEIVESVSILNDTYIYTLYAPEKSLIESAFMVLLADGNMKLLQRQVCSIEQNISVPYYMGGNGDGSYAYKKNTEYYFKRGDENAVKLPFSKRKLSKLFGNKSQDVLDYIDSEELNVRKKQEDIVQLFNYINNKM